MLPIISVLVENTLLKTTCHFLLLLIGFDTLTYQKGYDRSLILVGHHWTICQRKEGEEAAAGRRSLSWRGKERWINI